jgi:tetratricopeptide (TPR) repeat protein
LQGEYQEALALLERLVQEDPQNTDYRLTLSRCHRSILPVAWANEDDDLAADAKRQSIEILEQLTGEWPEEPTFQFELADTLAMTAEADLQTALTEANVAELQRSVELMAPLREQFPTAPEFTVLLADTHQKLGSHFLATKTWTDAQRHLTKANALLESLVVSSPANPLFQVSLARTRWKLAESLRRKSSLPQSRAVLEQAVNDYRLFRDSEAGRRTSVGLLVGLYRQLARTLEQLGEQESAAKISQTADRLRRAQP